MAITVDRLTKRFDRPAGWRRWKLKPGLTAVDEVSFDVTRGELFGLLGANGAGKTTLVKMLCTLILPNHGKATIAGYNLDQTVEIRRSVGLVVSDERSFYWRLSGRRNLDFFASMHGLTGSKGEERISSVLRDVGLVEHQNNPFSTYSTGMKQRLAIARGLLHEPTILFLDEPSRSLDPEATSLLHLLIRQLNDRNGVTVFLITHDLSEAEKLCSRVAIMDKGRIQAVGSPLELRNSLQPKHEYSIIVSPLDEITVNILNSSIQGITIDKQPSTTVLSLSASETDDRLTRVIDILRQHDAAIHKIDGRSPSMEAVFAHYVDDTGEEV